tara:strand:- start:15 stop:782 length:768 start_codon:yes stop_codon:yes gene_type:complete
MLFRLFSDLHNEFDKEEGLVGFIPPELPTDGETVLVLAGDIDIKGRAIKYANILSKRFKAVILVGGNHDYWGGNLSSIYNKWLEGAKENVYPLINSHVVIDDVVFCGGTLWTDYNDHDAFCMWKAKESMLEYHKIRYGDNYRKFTPTLALADHKSCLRAIQEGLSVEARKHVVVTHMSPSYSLGEPKYIGSEMEHYYHSNLDWLVPEADVWCFGHTHYNLERVVGENNTLVISNQRGYYPDHLVEGFDPINLREI